MISLRWLPIFLLSCDDPPTPREVRFQNSIVEQWWELTSGTDNDYVYLETREGKEGVVWYKAYLPFEVPDSNVNAGTWWFSGDTQVKVDLTEELQADLGLPIGTLSIDLTTQQDGCYVVTVEICNCQVADACPYEGPWMHP
jgi:hypothetical protein